MDYADYRNFVFVNYFVKYSVAEYPEFPIVIVLYFRTDQIISAIFQVFFGLLHQ